MRLSDLRDKQVRTLEGEKLGRVHEVHCDQGRIVALICGPGGLIERWTAKKQGRRIGWECVHRIEKDRIVVSAEPPRRRPPKASGPRSRKGTPRPSAQRSKR